MARSLKKGPYVFDRLLKKVKVLNETGKNMYVVNVDENIFVFDSGLKYGTDKMLGVDYIIPNVDYLIKNKDKFIPVYVTEDMVGHKLGEFSLTRKFGGHGENKKK